MFKSKFYTFILSTLMIILILAMFTALTGEASSETADDDVEKIMIMDENGDIHFITVTDTYAEGQASAPSSEG